LIDLGEFISSRKCIMFVAFGTFLTCHQKTMQNFYIINGAIWATLKK